MSLCTWSVVLNSTIDGFERTLFDWSLEIETLGLELAKSVQIFESSTSRNIDIKLFVELEKMFLGH
jgi:hypothetical protein